MYFIEIFVNSFFFFFGWGGAFLAQIKGFGSFINYLYYRFYESPMHMKLGLFYIIYFKIGHHAKIILRTEQDYFYIFWASRSRTYQLKNNHSHILITKNKPNKIDCKTWTKYNKTFKKHVFTTSNTLNNTKRNTWAVS